MTEDHRVELFAAGETHSKRPAVGYFAEDQRICDTHPATKATAYFSYNTWLGLLFV